MAQKKAGGSSRNGRDSAGRRLGLKCGDGQFVMPGHILVRQRGSLFFPDRFVGMGRDHTLYSKTFGRVSFFTRKGKRRICVVPEETQILA